MKLLCIGECMVEMAPRADGGYAMGFAGDTFNTAWYAARVPGGPKVAYLSAIGDDAASRDMAAFIEGAGVEPVLTVRGGMSVGLYLITLTDGERSFSYWRSASAARTLADDLGALPLKPGDMAYLSGITLAILPQEGRARLLEAVRAARGQGVRIAFDPNLRPRLWSDARDMRAWVTRGAELADIVLPSHEDEAAHFGDADPEATARRYLEAGAGLVAVKDGAGPVLLAEGETRTSVTPEPLGRPVDTTAAGDSFNARFLTGIMAGESPDTAARAACTLSGLVIGARGALVDCAVPPLG